MAKPKWCLKGSPIRPFHGVLTQRQQSTPSQAPTKKAPPPQPLPRYATPTKRVFREVPQKANASILKFLFQAGGDSKEKENVAIDKKTDEAKENQSKTAPNQERDHEWGSDELFQSANTSARKIITSKGKLKSYLVVPFLKVGDAYKRNLIVGNCKISLMHTCSN